MTSQSAFGPGNTVSAVVDVPIIQRPLLAAGTKYALVLYTGHSEYWLYPLGGPN